MLCGRPGISGTECVSQRTGKRTTLVSSAWSSFHCQTILRSSSRSLLVSDGEAMRIRRTFAENGMCLLSFEYPLLKGEVGNGEDGPCYPTDCSKDSKYNCRNIPLCQQPRLKILYRLLKSLNLGGKDSIIY